MEAEDRAEGDEVGQPDPDKHNESAAESHSEDYSEDEDNSDENFDQSELKDEEEDSQSLPAVREPISNTKDRARLTRTRSRNKQTNLKTYELRREPNRQRPRPVEEKTERQNRQLQPKKEQEKNLEVYVRIIEYLKKIEWDQQNSQNKMNPFHFMTAQCFWFVICAEYFSYNFFTKKNAEEAATEVMSKVTRINYPVPLRISKNTMMELPKPYNPPFETNALLKLSEKVSEALKEVVPSVHYDYYYESTERIQALSEIADDDMFRSTTRALVYNYVKEQYKNRLDTVLSVDIPQENASIEKQSQNEREEAIVEEPYLEESDKKLETDQKKSDKQLEPAPEEQPGSIPNPRAASMEIEQAEDSAEERERLRRRPYRVKRELGRQELLLSGIRHMPIEKMISVLAAQLPENRLPHIEESFIPVPTDPFQLINQTHPLDMEFLEYLKQRRRKENLLEIATQAQKAQKQSAKNKANPNVDPTLDDAKCQICTDGDYTEDNLIVFCSTCNISLHQRCVGLMKVPTENWVCDLCLAFGPKGRWLRCALCTVKGGALKRTTISSDTQIFKQTNPSYHEYLRSCTHNKNKEEYISPNLQLKSQQKHHPHHHHEGKYPHTHPHNVAPKPEQSDHIQLPVQHIPTETKPEPPKPPQEQPEPSQQQERLPSNPNSNEGEQPGEDQPNEEDDEKQLYYNYYNLDEEAVEEPPDCHFVWVHYTCAVWVPEVYFEERNGTINIKGVETIDKKRFKIMCEICQTSRTGACIKCAEQECTLSYHAECARKAGVYMEQRYIDRMQYFIYCNLHKPIKVSRVIESKSKKYKDQIIKFCRCIEKYVETYKIASVPFKLLKTSKKNGKVRKEGRARESREDRENENQDFMKKLKEFLLGNRKLIIQLKKTSDGYKVIDVEEPVKRALRSNITKNDEIWEFFSYRNLGASQLFKKYKRIMKENAVLRDAFVKEIKSQSKSERKSERRNRNSNKDYAVVDEDPNKPYCLCRKPYLPGELMLECQVCGEWFHFRCIGFIGTEEDGGESEFNCYRCQRYQPLDQIEERRKKYVKFYDPNFTPQIPEDDDIVEASEEVRQPEYPVGSNTPPRDIIAESTKRPAEQAEPVVTSVASQSVSRPIKDTAIEEEPALDPPA